MMVMERINQIFILMIILVPAVILAGCATPTPAATPTPVVTPSPAPTAASPSPAAASGDQLALQIGGKVSHPANYTLSELRSYPSFNASVLFKDNNTYDLNGVSLNRLLDDAGVAADATAIDLIASDGYRETVNLSDVRASRDAMVHIGGGLPICCASDNLKDNELKAILPGMPFPTWASHLIAIEVK